MEKLLTIRNLGTRKPHFTKNGNIKLGDNMWVWSTMKGSNDEVRYIKALDGYCSGTCGEYCKECTKSCYVNRSYRYGSVILGHAVNTVWLKNDISKTFEQLVLQIKRAKKKPSMIRINQSGELTCADELIKWANLAKQYPEINMYLYTKNYDAVANLVECENNISHNLTILISVWHNLGVAEFEKWKHIPNIKAFVYDDGELHLKPTTYCNAYDEKGKLNHDITCEKCKKCFSRSANHKIVGCKAH